MQARVEWADETQGFLSGTTACAWGGRHHLVVEELPFGGWDWVAWANDGSRRCLHGTAATRDAAVAGAESAALLLSRSPLNGRSVLTRLVLN